MGVDMVTSLDILALAGNTIEEASYESEYWSAIKQLDFECIPSFEALVNEYDIDNQIKGLENQRAESGFQRRDTLAA